MYTCNMIHQQEIDPWGIKYKYVQKWQRDDFKEKKSKIL